MAATTKTLSIDQMEQFLATLHGQRDGKVAEALGTVQLTERVSEARLARWEAEFPGKRTRENLQKLADLSTFLNPPASDVVADPRPEVKTQLQILSLAVKYVKNTMSQLPDFFAIRETKHFEELSLLPSKGSGGKTYGFRLIGSYQRTVTYRHGEEVPFRGSGKIAKRPPIGLTSNGEFGPILFQVFRDALENQIRFLRWEKGTTGTLAVFGYFVPEKASHFQIGENWESRSIVRRPAYHGEIAIDPAVGAVLRLSEIADLTPNPGMQHAAIEVDYAPVGIGGENYMCPVRAIAYSRMPLRMEDETDDLPYADNPNRPIVTNLNAITFTHYHIFVSEARILP